MRILSLIFSATLALCCSAARVNLTPLPRQMTVGAGELVLPPHFQVSVPASAPDFYDEAVRFAAALRATTPSEAQVVRGKRGALITIAADPTLGEEEYALSVTTRRVAIRAHTTAGLYYALQTVKKLLPGGVIAGVRDAAATRYALPVVEISDAPRFAYRGFMLDVSRHFFTVEEVKRMIDVMSWYKLNRFHWHLTDDHGWRMEVKKYPRLTTVGATAPNSKFTDMKTGQYLINRPYGPYFYTREEMRQVVAYASERHIQVVPEVDMPGHFVAAMKAYPEYSCYPGGSHELWVNPGVSEDVLNVADPGAVQFAKDILAEVMEVFPGRDIHIGGDECPTIAWKSNEQCRQLYRQEGLTSYRQLQSRFIGEISRFVAARGRHLMVWNESITAAGADTALIRSTGATVFCWYPAVEGQRKAMSMGMQNIFTPIGPYYINRRQSTDPGEPVGAGKGDDTVEKTYMTEPVPETATPREAATCIGVQGTFWTEFVSDRAYMEYLALPRLIAIAETAWSPQRCKDFADFCRRITADSHLLDLAGYHYGRHYIGAGTE